MVEHNVKAITFSLAARIFNSFVKFYMYQHYIRKPSLLYSFKSFAQCLE